MDSRGKLRQLFSCLETDLSTVVISDETTRYAADRLASRMRKRAQLGDSTLKQKAIDGFFSTNERMRDFKVLLDDEILRNARHYILVALERYSTSVNDLNIQVPLDHVHFYDLWKFGPGTCNGTKGSHAVFKIGQPWSCSPNAIPGVQRLRHNHPYLSAYDGMKQGYTQIRGSALSTVPKNEEKDRTIAFEPLGNMVLQLAAHKYLANTLKLCGLDLSNQQEKNRFLAHKGSITGALATLDLSNASDTIHPDLVRALFPASWWNLLCSIRSEEIQLKGSEEWHKLYMMSTMGCGFTFSLMTLVIASLLYGFRCTKGGPTLYIDWTQSAVYGDDIIVPVDDYLGFSSVLEGCGFVVNHEKSFATGHFRESCGGDYWNGRDVSPFYVSSLNSDSEVYVAINKIVNWCGLHGLLLTKTLSFLLSCLRGKLLLVPEWSEDDSGLRCTVGPRRYKLLRPELGRYTIPDDHLFLMTLACGGYVSDVAGRNTCMLRQFKTKYIATRARLPRGFLDGRDPRLRSCRTSSYGDFVAYLGMTLA